MAPLVVAKSEHFLHILVQNSTKQAFLLRNWTKGGLFDSILLKKMQGNAKNYLILLLRGAIIFEPPCIVLFCYP